MEHLFQGFATVVSLHWDILAKVTQCIALCVTQILFTQIPCCYVPPEFFTAGCKIGWDWINLERCYSPKLNMADRMIGYLWSIKSVMLSPKNVSRNITYFWNQEQSTFQKLRDLHTKETLIIRFDRQKYSYHVSLFWSFVAWLPTTFLVSTMINPNCNKKIFCD